MQGSKFKIFLSILVSPTFAKKLIKEKTEVDFSKVKQIIDMTEEILDFVYYFKKQETV